MTYPDDEPIDWKHTPAAVEAREAKATAIGKQLLLVRMPVEQARALDKDGRREYEKAIGLDRRASDETWERALQLLQARYAWEAMQPQVVYDDEPEPDLPLTGPTVVVAPCGCPQGPGRQISDQVRHDAYHLLVAEQTGLTRGPIDLDALRDFRGASGGHLNDHAIQERHRRQGKSTSAAVRKALRSA